MIHHIEQISGSHIRVNGKNYHYFGGTSYLGVASDKEFQELLIKNIQKYGTNFGSSRNSNIKLPVYEEAEAQLAAWVGASMCITLSSGYLAGQLLGSFYNSPSFSTYYAPGCHSSLHHGFVKNYESYEILLKELQQDKRLKNGTTPVVFIDSIDFSGQGYPKFKGLQSLPMEEIILIVDDSHGIGILGESGSGVFRMLQAFGPKELLVCCSLGKALGIQAGAIFGSFAGLEALKATAFFSGASPAAPASIATAQQAFHIYESKRRLLQRNTQVFIEQIKDLTSFKYIQGYPVFSYSDKNLTAYLVKNGIIVTDFPYNSAVSGLSGRIVLNAVHEETDITRLTKLLNTYMFR